MATPVQKAPCVHAWQLATEALSTRPKVPAGQLQLVKATLPANDTEGGGQPTAAVDPAAQKLLAGQVSLELLETHRLPAGHWVEDVLPASQKAPGAHAVAEVDPATQTVPAGHRSCAVELGQKDPAAHETLVVEPDGQKVPDSHAAMVAGELHTLPAGHGITTVVPAGQ